MKVGAADMDIACKVFHQENGDTIAFVRRMVREYTYPTDEIVVMVETLTVRNRAQSFQFVHNVLKDIEAEKVVTSTDCRSDEGITVGILDSIITMCRLYKSREVTPAVREALKDLATDEDFAKLLKDIQSS